MMGRPTILEHLCKHYSNSIQVDQAPQVAKLADSTAKNFENLKDAMVSETPKVCNRCQLLAHLFLII